MDFSIIIEEHGQRDQPPMISDKLMRAKKLGYQSIALDIRMEESRINKDLPSLPTLTIKSSERFQIFTRLTTKMSSSLNMHKLNKKTGIQAFDLLALEVEDEKVFNQICSGQIDCDIVCLNMQSSKLQYLLRKANLRLPLEKGVVFEINFFDLIANQTSRINAIGNARLLVDKCKGKSIIFSSCAKSFFDLRSPADLVNLCNLFGFPPHLSKASVFQNGYKALKHASVRKNPTTNAMTLDNNPEKWILQELEEDEGLKSSDNKNEKNSLKRKMGGLQDEKISKLQKF